MHQGYRGGSLVSRKFLSYERPAPILLNPSTITTIEIVITERNGLALSPPLRSLRMADARAGLALVYVVLEPSSSGLLCVERTGSYGTGAVPNSNQWRHVRWVTPGGTSLAGKTNALMTLKKLSSEAAGISSVARWPSEALSRINQLAWARKCWSKARQILGGIMVSRRSRSGYRVKGAVLTAATSISLHRMPNGM